MDGDERQGDAVYCAYCKAPLKIAKLERRRRRRAGRGLLGAGLRCGGGLDALAVPPQLRVASGAASRRRGSGRAPGPGARRTPPGRPGSGDPRRTTCASASSLVSSTSAPSKSGPGAAARRVEDLRAHLPVRPDQAEPHHRPEARRPRAAPPSSPTRERTQRSRWKKNVSPTQCSSWRCSRASFGSGESSGGSGKRCVEEIEDGRRVLHARAADVDHGQQAVRGAPALVVLRALRLLEREGQSLPVERARDLDRVGRHRGAVERDARRHRERHSLGCDPAERSVAESFDGGCCAARCATARRAPPASRRSATARAAGAPPARRPSRG